MDIVSALAIFFIIWWTVFFAVLPWGVRTQQEEGNVHSGTAPSAPVRPRLWRKVLWTTTISALVLAALWIALEAGVTIDDLPFPNPLSHTTSQG